MKAGVFHLEPKHKTCGVVAGGCDALDRAACICVPALRKCDKAVFMLPQHVIRLPNAWDANEWCMLPGTQAERHDY
jgi:hypothetical protein